MFLIITDKFIQYLISPDLLKAVGNLFPFQVYSLRYHMDVIILRVLVENEKIRLISITHAL